MSHIKPDIMIPHDNSDRVMYNAGEITAKTRDRALWRFGFSPISDLAKQHNVTTGDQTFVWVMADKTGKIIDTYTGWFLELPDPVKLWADKHIYSSDPKIAAEKRKHTKLYNEYKKEVSSWDWSTIKKDCESNFEEDSESYDTIRGMSFLGTVFTIMPSGKFYMPWTTNQTEEDEYKDSVFMEVLEEIANSHDLTIESGEGDPCDLFAVLYIDTTV